MKNICDYRLTRSKRKTAVIYVRDGGVEVRAPLHMAKRDIDRLVASKEKWITDRLARSREAAERRRTFALGYGDTVTLRGAEYAITAKSGTRAGFDGETFYMPPDLPPEQIKAACVRIYRQIARIHLAERVRFYAERMGVTPAAVRISGAAKRWGSCSAGRTISFSWRLIMSGDDEIDYVVAHELAHLTEMNHSARFWAIVEGVLPDFRQRRARLRELQQRLSGEDWD
ncbi:MAG: M48 family metallopeptidase [Gracilibacteraceae bacterium]|nr:M48 family metallopeptidase [Gracilibacteraceae bacterium]